MKFFDLLFCTFYRNIERTNKSIPEWSTIIAISILLFFNVFCFLSFFDLPIKNIGKIGFLILGGLILFLNYLYFLNNNKYKIILKRYTNNGLLQRGLFAVYLIATFFLLFISMDLNFKYFYILIGGFIIIELVITMQIKYQNKN